MASFENKDFFKLVLSTAKELLKAQNKNNIASILNNANVSAIQTDYDNWNGGINFYTVYVDVDVTEFVKLELTSVEEEIVETLNTVTRFAENEVFSKAIISPQLSSKTDWSLVDFSKEELLKRVDYLKNTMIAVSTGGPQIQTVEREYKQTYSIVNSQLKKLDIENPNHYESLWSWYSKWSADFRSYRERRDYINEIYKQLITILSEAEDARIVDVNINLSSWDKIRRSIIEIKRREKQAQNEEQYQALGMLCRELIITLAQTVYNPEKHKPIDGTEISKTDAQRMLESYIQVILAGNKSEELRAYAKTTNKLANALTHKRTATKKEMMLCTTATLALINFIGVLEDKI
ncbi:MAG: hypothetical protein LBC70_03120 [Chitinispirillales bacterium]|jgi:hypothetical protein|nr:hypothetical protein [Chitinispirillales bacterium]